MSSSSVSASYHFQLSDFHMDSGIQGCFGQQRNPFPQTCPLSCVAQQGLDMHMNH